MQDDNKILILGIGNVLLGDEGVGVHVVRELEKHDMPPYIALLDGGTGGFHLLSWLQDYHKIILIDATLDDRAPGTVSVIHPRFANDFPRTLSSHDIGLKDLIEAASLLGELPEITLITVSVHPEQSLSMELSSEIRGSVAVIIKKILRMIDRG
jgi:hydrogenase maturation protease